MPQCSGIKRDGGRCTATVTPSSEHCYQHDPERKGERKRNASKAGKARPSSEIAGIKDEIKTVITAVLAGELETGPASVSIQGYNTLLRAVEIGRRTHDLGELMARLDELEQRAAQLRGV